MGTGDDIFRREVEWETFDDGIIRNWAMEAKIEEDKYLFHLVELEQKEQSYFTPEKERTAEAEKWMDRCFDWMLQEYRTDKCKEILRGEGHVRQENHVRISPKISAYLQGLQLTRKPKNPRQSHR